MTFKKLLKFGCLGIVGLFVLLIVVGLIGNALMSPQEKARLAAERQAAAVKAEADEKAATAKTLADQKQSAGDLLRKLTLIRRCLPLPGQWHEQQATPSPDFAKVTYNTADGAFIRQFAETGYARMADENPHLWYRGQPLEDVQKALAPDVAPEKREVVLAKAAADFEDKLFLAVFFPLDEAYPVLNTDNKIFTPGYFKGWVILVDTKKEQPIAQTLFEAESSPKVRNFRPRVAGIRIGSGMETAVADDFTGNFWSAANTAIGKALPQN